MPFSAILWDNDGTLVDTEPLYYRATRDVLATVAVELTETHYIQMGLGEGRSMFDLAQERGVDPELIERLRERRNLDYGNMLDAEVPLRPGIRDCLASLLGRARMGIVTSSMRDHFARMHRRSALLPYFEFVLTREDFNRTKPDPDSYLTAAARHDLDPRSCLVIEDSVRGVSAAKRAGMTCWVLETSFAPPGGFPEADRVLPGARELQKDLLALLVAR